jgi:hypothetical protein
MSTPNRPGTEDRQAIVVLDAEVSP